MIITRAAIMYSNGEVLGGRNYGDVSALGSKLGFGGDKMFGFLTSSDEFVTPGEAAVIAVQSGQLRQVIGKLEPEDLWPERDNLVEC